MTPPTGISIMTFVPDIKGTAQVKAPGINSCTYSTRVCSMNWPCVHAICYYAFIV